MRLQDQALAACFSRHRQASRGFTHDERQLRLQLQPRSTLFRPQSSRLLLNYASARRPIGVGAEASAASERQVLVSSSPCRTMSSLSLSTPRRCLRSRRTRITVYGTSSIPRKSQSTPRPKILHTGGHGRPRSSGRRAGTTSTNCGGCA